MPKLRVLSGADVCGILSRFGFLNVRQKGSHIIMQKKSTTTTVTVPVPNHSEIKRGNYTAVSGSGD